MIPLKKNEAIGILEEHGKSTADAEAYFDFMDTNGYMLIENAGGLIPVPKSVESLEEDYITDPKDAGCFIERDALELLPQEIPQGEG